jgi:hypothetical protein
MITRIMVMIIGRRLIKVRRRGGRRIGRRRETSKGMITV